MERELVIGVDIGGSHITAGIVDLHSHGFIEGSLVREEVNSNGSVEEIICQWKKAVSSLDGFGSSVKKMGIAMPGPFDYDHCISLIKSQNKYEALYGLNAGELLAEALGITPDHIRFRNDAACFLQGEVFAGAAKGAKRAIGLTLGTGLGTSRYFGGFAQDAALWRMPFRGGIVEDFISTRWFLDCYQKKTGQAINNVKELAIMAAEDSASRDTFAEFARHLTLFLSDFIQKDRPEVVVLGGNISKASPLFLSAVQEQLKEMQLEVSINISQLGEKAALIGAAFSWK